MSESRRKVGKTEDLDQEENQSSGFLAAKGKTHFKEKMINCVK